MAVLPLLILIALFLAPISRAQQPVITEGQASTKAGLHALIVANEAYPHLSPASVAHSISDARAIRAALVQVGFQVQMEENVPNVPRMLGVERTFLSALHPGDKVVFYFSGYGFQFGRENYLAPTNYTYDPRRTDELQEDAYQATRLQQELADKKIDFSVLVLDACREENILRAAFDPGLTYPSDKTTRTLIALPAHPGEFVPKERPGQQQGQFASAFVAALAKPGLNVRSDFFEDVKKTVSDATKGEQVPTVVLNNITKDFYFVLPLLKIEEPKTIQNPKDRLTYIRIPEGKFKMGCVDGDPNCKSDEMPNHEVTISKRFWISSTEVTAKAYQEFLQGPKVKGRTEKKGGKRAKMPPGPTKNTRWQFTDRPIVSVPWEEAQDYCKWVGGRLPTEAEWEFAARGGQNGTIYPWGNTFNPKWAATEVDTAQPATTYPPNGYGLYDMIGNVWEWTQDVYDPDYYQESAGATDPKAPSGGGAHVKRGGSYRGRKQDLRTSIRKPLAGQDNITGFRCVLEEAPGENKPSAK